MLPKCYIPRSEVPAGAAIRGEQASETQSGSAIRQRGAPTVRWKRIRLFGRVVVVCLLMVGTSGCWYCRPRHGFIVRGDWSLELNRVPWLVSRSDAHEECSVSGGDCLGGWVSEEEVSGCEASGSPTPAPVPADAISCCPQEGKQGCRLCSRCGQALCGGPVQPAGATDPYIHPRFHPVPTRPVFSRREDCLPGTEANAGLQEGGVSVSTGDSGRAPSVEEIPAPVPENAGGWRAKDPPQNGDGGSNSSSSPSVELKLGPIARNQSN